MANIKWMDHVKENTNRLHLVCADVYKNIELFFRDFVENVGVENSEFHDLINYGGSQIVILTSLSHNSLSYEIGEDNLNKCKIISSVNQVHQDFGRKKLLLIYNYDFSEYKMNLTTAYHKFVNEIIHDKKSSLSILMFIQNKKNRLGMDSIPTQLLYFSSSVINLKESIIEVKKDRSGDINPPLYDTNSLKYYFE